MISVDQIRAAIKKAGVQSNVDLLPLNQTFIEIGLDSLDIFNIFLEIEKQFNVTLPDEEIDHLQTIEAIQIYLRHIEG